MNITGMTIQVNDNEPIEFTDAEDMKTNQELRGQVHDAIKHTIGDAPGRDRVRRQTVNGRSPDDLYDVPTAADFLQEKVDEHGEITEVKRDYLPAEDIEEIALALIERHERQFEHLSILRVRYFWKREGGTSNGRATLGQCQKASGLLKQLIDGHFMIWLAADHLHGQATNWTIEALVYHELLHAGVNYKTFEPKIKPHDAELFVNEFRDYGLWRFDLRMVADAVKQMPLFDGEGWPV